MASLFVRRQTCPPGGAWAAHGWILTLQLPGTRLAEKALPHPHGSPQVATAFLPSRQAHRCLLRIWLNEVRMSLSNFRVSVSQTFASRRMKGLKMKTSSLQSPVQPRAPPLPLQPLPGLLTSLSQQPATCDLRSAHTSRPRAAHALCGISKAPWLSVSSPHTGRWLSPASQTVVQDPPSTRLPGDRVHVRVEATDPGHFFGGLCCLVE